MTNSVLVPVAQLHEARPWQNVIVPLTSPMIIRDSQIQLSFSFN